MMMNVQLINQIMLNMKKIEKKELLIYDAECFYFNYRFMIIENIFVLSSELKLSTSSCFLTIKILDNIIFRVISEKNEVLKRWINDAIRKLCALDNIILTTCACITLSAKLDEPSETHPSSQYMYKVIIQKFPQYCCLFIKNSPTEKIFTKQLNVFEFYIAKILGFNLLFVTSVTYVDYFVYALCLDFNLYNLKLINEYLKLINEYLIRIEIIYPIIQKENIIFPSKCAALALFLTQCELKELCFMDDEVWPQNAVDITGYEYEDMCRSSQLCIDEIKKLK